MPTNQPTKSYTSIRIDGPISVEEVPDLPSVGRSIVLLLGPTGSGKSSFIEALAPKGSLQISSPLLEGCTQSITAYRVENVTSLMYNKIYIVDVPGFGDTKISEMSIVSMIMECMRKMGVNEIGRILYFTPINVVRLPGSQRQLLKTFQTLTGIKTAGNIIIVSTMWDLLSGEDSINRAKRNFEQLQDVVWKDYIESGSLIVKFHNTPESVLSILDDACRDLVGEQFYIETSSQISKAAFGADLYNNLQIRIQNLQIERANVHSELAVARLRSDPQLISVLSSQLEETEKILAKFNQELEDFDAPPDSPSEASATLSALNHQLVNREVLLHPAEAVPYIHPDSHESTLPSHPTPAKRGIFGRAILSLKCWGQEVQERHDL